MRAGVKKEILGCHFLYYDITEASRHKQHEIQFTRSRDAKASLSQLAPVHEPPPYPTSSYPRGPAALG